jgi:ribosomal protein RSM22 (predicted rRNA methylase)
VVAIDRDGDALSIAARSLSALAGARARITTRRGDVAVALPACDLVLLGSVLNELAADTRVATVERALAAIGDDGAVIVIEPALRETSRALHAVRDHVLARGLAHVFAPCTRAIAPCPALADPDDWCHEDRPLALPPRAAELARVTHLRDGGMKLAYLVLRRDPTPLVAAEAAWRIVSAPRVGKGKRELFGCSDAGRVPLRLLARHRSPANRAFEDAHRGDVLVTPATSDGTRVEVDGSTAVEHIEPARELTSSR